VKRQQSRLQTGLAELNHLKLASAAPYDDAELRIACFLDWALFRQRIALDGFPNLQKFLEGIRKYPHFAATAPKG
jgi:glutathione S-transferase